jgi:hypothetical protein
LWSFTFGLACACFGLTIMFIRWIGVRCMASILDERAVSNVWGWLMVKHDVQAHVALMSVSSHFVLLLNLFVVFSYASQKLDS